VLAFLSSNLAGEVGQEYQKKQEENQAAEQVLQLVDIIVPFHIRHNAEHEAIDLLMEVEQLHRLIDYVDDTNLERVCLYLKSCADYVPEPEDTQVFRVALDIYKKMGRHPSALHMAIRLNDMNEIRSIYESCPDAYVSLAGTPTPAGLNCSLLDSAVKKQLAFILARQNLFHNIDESDESLTEIIYHTNLSEHFLALARDLGV